MRKSWSLLSGILLVSALSALPAFAQSDPTLQSFYIAPEVSYVLPTDSDVDDSVFVGMKAGYNFDHNFALEIESGWMELGVETGFDDNIDVEVIPVLLNLRYNTDRCSWGNMYFFGGAGAAFNHLEARGGLEIEDSFVWQLGLGAETPISEDIDAFADVRYFWNEADIDDEDALVGVDASTDAKLQAVMFTLGLEF